MQHFTCWGYLIGHGNSHLARNLAKVESWLAVARTKLEFFFVLLLKLRLNFLKKIVSAWERAYCLGLAVRTMLKQVAARPPVCLLRDWVNWEKDVEFERFAVIIWSGAQSKREYLDYDTSMWCKALWQKDLGTPSNFIPASGQSS